MIDINLLRQQPELIKTALQNRQKDPSVVDQILTIDTDRRQILSQVEELRAQQKIISQSFSPSASPSPSESEDQISESNIIREKSKEKAINNKKQLKELEIKLKEVEDKQNLVLEEIPNIPADDVPVGKDDADNVVYKTVGEKPKFDFKPLDHADLGEKLDIIDIKKAAKLSGSRFGYFKGQGAVLEMAVMFYAFNKLIKKGFTGMVPPVMIKSDTEWKCGYASNKNLMNAYYSIPEDDLIFISSSEHSVVPYHMDEILDAKSFPIKYVNFSPCFRREAGTYGKDMKGMLRVHFFNKVEMNIFTLPDYKISDEMCLEMLANEEELMQELEIPYQVMKCCTGDLPQPNRRMYDINSWFPGQDNYRETQSCSNCGDYQARRLNTKVKLEGKNELVHILNATLVTDRAVLAIIENHQQADGSIKIPKVLHPYTNFEVIKPKIS